MHTHLVLVFLFSVQENMAKVEGNFRDFLAALEADKLPVDDPKFEPQLSVEELDDDNNRVRVTFTAFDGKLVYTQEMTLAQWVSWQAAAKERANFTFS